MRLARRARFVLEAEARRRGLLRSEVCVRHGFIGVMEIDLQACAARGEEWKPPLCPRCGKRRPIPEDGLPVKWLGQEGLIAAL